MARNFFWIVTKNNPRTGDRKKYNIPDVNSLSSTVLVCLLLDCQKKYFIYSHSCQPFKIPFSNETDWDKLSFGFWSHLYDPTLNTRRMLKLFSLPIARWHSGGRHDESVNIQYGTDSDFYDRYLFIYLPHPTAETPPVTGMGSININIKITISKNSLYINKAFNFCSIKKKI